MHGKFNAIRWESHAILIKDCASLLQSVQYLSLIFLYTYIEIKLPRSHKSDIRTLDPEKKKNFHALMGNLSFSQRFINQILLANSVLSLTYSLKYDSPWRQKLLVVPRWMANYTKHIHKKTLRAGQTSDPIPKFTSPLFFSWLKSGLHKVKAMCKSNKKHGHIDAVIDLEPCIWWSRSTLHYDSQTLKYFDLRILYVLLPTLFNNQGWYLILKAPEQNLHDQETWGHHDIEITN